MKTNELQHVHAQFDLMIPFYLEPADWWILTCCGISHHCSPSYIPAVCGHSNFFDGGGVSFTLFFLMAWFLSWIFFLFVSSFFSCRCYCVCRYPSFLHLCAGCKTAVELRWEVRELQRHQGEQAICACVCACVFLLLCSAAQWFDFMRPQISLQPYIGLPYDFRCFIFMANHCAACVVPFTWPPLTLGRRNLSVVLWEMSLKWCSVNTADS